MTPDLRDLQRAGNVQVINGMVEKNIKYDKQSSCGSGDNYTTPGGRFPGFESRFSANFLSKKTTYTFLVESVLRE